MKLIISQTCDVHRGAAFSVPDWGQGNVAVSYVKHTGTAGLGLCGSTGTDSAGTSQQLQVGISLATAHMSALPVLP